MSLFFDIANVVALAASPLIAVQVSERLARSREKQDAKKKILFQLFSYRNDETSDKFFEALNSIAIVYRDDEEVRRLNREYFDAIVNPGLSNPIGDAQRRSKFLELVAALARANGYSNFPENEFHRGLKKGVSNMQLDNAGSSGMQGPIRPISPQQRTSATKPLRPGERLP